MRDALAAGVTVAEVAELTGYHHNSVRRIVDAAAEE
jgi:DNA-binding IclR family transcriptional regulator